MSRKPGQPGLAPGSMSASDDMCPVCKTNRYFNKDMEFLINPECYHPMCLNCVNRLFNDGPNQCPYAGCNKTLRRKNFKSAFFGDLSVEREVDIRKRVAAVFNAAEDDFETLRDYNDYLQMVEDLTFDLVQPADEGTRRKAEAQLADWELEHKAEIERNKKAGRAADEATRRRMAAEREAARQRRADALREAEEERLRKVRDREDELDELAAAPEGVAGKVMLKRRNQKHHPATTAGGAGAGPGQTHDIPMRDAHVVDGDQAAKDRMFIRGLKDKSKPARAEGPYDPFGDSGGFAPDRYRLRDRFADRELEEASRNWRYTVGGYDARDYYSRAMFDAFAGLAVFVGDEKDTGSLDMSAGEVAGFGAGLAAEQSGPVVKSAVKMDVGA